jgi:hypothetical protein
LLSRLPDRLPTKLVASRCSTRSALIAAIDYYAHINSGGQEDFWDEDVPVHKVGYSIDLLGSRAVDTINDYVKAGQPFLVSLHFNAPPFTWEAPGDDVMQQKGASWR